MVFPINYIDTFNFALIIILLLCLYSGYQSGILKLIDILGYFLTAIIAWIVAPYLSNIIQILPKEYIPFQDALVGPIVYTYLNRHLVFSLLFIILGIALSVVRTVVKKVCKIKLFYKTNQLIGLFLGFVQAVFIFIIISIVFSTPVFTNGSYVQNNSIIKYVNPVKNQITSLAKNEFNKYSNVQDLLLPTSNGYSDEQINQLKTILKDNGISENEIEIYINDLLSKYK